MSTFGLVSYSSVLVRPRVAFERLKNLPTWGWAAAIGLLLTLGAFLVPEPAQLHVLAASESHRIAALPPGERVRAQMAHLQIAGSLKSLFILGALIGPWITWFLMALFFFVTAAISRGRASFGMAWVVALNCYVVYGVAGMVNATLLATRDPNLVNSASRSRRHTVSWLAVPAQPCARGLPVCLQSLQHLVLHHCGDGARQGVERSTVRRGICDDWIQPTLWVFCCVRSRRAALTR